MDPGLLPLAQAQGQGEIRLLQRAQSLGFPVVESWVVGLWEEFARLNNLSERIQRLFQGVFGVRIDEERLLLAAEEAERAVRESYLLPERAEAFLQALQGKGPFLLRRPGEGSYRLAHTPQEALFALKRLWAEAFRVEAILEGYPFLFPPSAPVLVQALDTPGKDPLLEVQEDPFLSLDLFGALGERVVAYTWGGLLLRIESQHGG
ncbi:hypothetical protein [uncultured Thermus sp.]|uniref:hypothetical protein n=1 Tax=uncultured Thermus sp. TaxID=157149 RepID=UPI00260F9105|nr:hypothetical protein [uncultured Thermus sp.]